jgi:hypothetical protein
MARKTAQSDPILSIEFFLSGFYTHRSQLFAPFKGIGVNVVSFHDPVIDGQNMEDTDLYEWTRRPGFSLFCSQPLQAGEIVDQFYSMRNLFGVVIPFFDSNQRLATFSPTTITPIITKTGTGEGYITAIQNMVYFSDGTSADMLKWQSALPYPSTINPSTWGIPAPTLTPTIFALGDWLPFTGKVINNAILDPNGNVEVVTKTAGGVAGVTGANEPLWPTTTAAIISDGSLQWTNMGPLSIWQPLTAFPVPVVITDTNGNLELATVVNSPVLPWNSTTAYTVGITVTFGGNYWTAVADNTDTPPNTGITWVLSQDPNTTSSVPPTWNPTVGGTTVDGAFTWTNIGPGSLIESFGTSYVYCYRTIYGHLSTASPVSINTGSIFGPTAATITQFSITADIVTFIGTNNFIPGNVFTVQNLTSTVGQALNNQPFVVLATGLTPTSFSAVFDYPNTPATVDSGSTTNLIASVTGVGTSSPLCNAVVNITATEVVAGVVTIYAANTFVPGLEVTFEGVTVATFLNGVQFQIIAVDPNLTWFQVYYTNSLGVVPPNQPTTTDTGTATFNAIEIYRTSDGGGIYLFTGAVTNPTTSGGTTVPYDSGTITAGAGADNGVPGVHVWANPNNVTSASAYATVAVPTPSGGGGGGNFHRIQTCQAIAAGETALVVTAAFPGSVTAGDQLVVFVTTYDVTTFTLSDSQGDTFSQIAQQVSPNDHGVTTCTVYLCRAAIGGPTTVSLAVTEGGSNNDFFGFQAMECSGLNGTVEGPESVYQASGVTLNTGTLLTTVPNTVVFSFIWSDLGTSSGSPATIPAGYTSLANQVVFASADGSSFQQMGSAYQVETVTGTYSPTWATPANNKGIGITLALDLSLAVGSDGLDATNYDIAVPAGIVVSGIEIEFDAFFTGTTPFGVLDVQLLKAGTPTGTVVQVFPTNSVVTYTLGGPGSLFGTTWVSTDFNSPAFGVQITAQQVTGGTDATFDVRNVRIRLVGSTNTTGWVFNDFTTDANLNILLIAPQNHLNDPPPGAPGSSVNQIVGTLTAYWNGRPWMAVGNFVYFGAGPDCVNGVPEESWPPANRFQFVGPVMNLIPTADGVGLLVYLADRVNAILGGPETIAFYPTDALSNFGISNPNAIFKDGSVIGQFTTQKQYFEILSGQKQEIGEHVADYLTANFSPFKTYATMHRDGLDVGVFLSNGVDQVLRYGTNISAWSVPSFPISGAGALRSIETSVGVYSLMLAAPNAGSSATLPITNPSSGASLAGSNVPWINPSNITLGVATDYATVTLSSVAPSNPAVLTNYSAPDTGPSGDTYTTIISPSNTNPLEVGDYLIFYNVVGNSTLTPPTVGGITDSQGNVWTRILPAQTAVYTAGTISASCEVWATILTAPVVSPASITVVATASGTWQGGQSRPMIVRGLTGAIANFIQNTGVYTPDQPLTGTLVTSETAFVVSFEGGPFNIPVGATPAPVGFTNAIAGAGTWAGSAAYQLGAAGSYTDQWNLNNEGSGIGWASTLVAFLPFPGTTQSSNILAASKYPMNLPVGAVIQGVQVSVTGKTTQDAIEMTITPLNPVGGAEADTFTLTGSNTTQVFGGPTDLWNMPAWISPSALNTSTFGFGITAVADGVSGTVSISEVQVQIFYQYPANYLMARDTTTNSDLGLLGDNNGTPYPTCFITIGSITLSGPGAILPALQHVVGYFDSVGTKPNIWILPNEISDTKGVGFIQLPEFVEEPPVGVTNPSESLWQLRWPVDMINSSLASQFVHHLQVKIMFNPENAPNTIKAISFKEDQS